MSHRLDDASALAALLQQWGAPPAVLTRLQATGFTTLGLLAHALPSPDAEDSFICTVLELDPADAALLHTATAASLRRPSSGSIPSLTSAQPSAAHKLTPSEVQDMRKKFLSSYPGELLIPELMPAPEFLSALQHALSTGASPCLPWRSRCTEADAISWHDARRPRTDRQLLRSFLEAEEESPGPTAYVPTSGPVEPTVRKALSVLATALAMLEKVHLLVIKRFNDKFLSFALAVPSDQSLRGPSLQEILAADRSVWQSVHALMRDQSWSLSDSLNEIAFCRQDMSSALQPRPRAQHAPQPRVPLVTDPSVPPPPSPPGGQKRKRRSGGGQGGNGRPKPKAKTSASASAQQVPAAKAFDKTWFKKVNGVETCMRGAFLDNPMITKKVIKPLSINFAQPGGSYRKKVIIWIFPAFSFFPRFFFSEKLCLLAANIKICANFTPMQKAFKSFTHRQVAGGTIYPTQSSKGAWKTS